ncbi:MAG: hypothetical protein LBI59_10945 [Candidatus Accumulibacter sp.]|jgi:hypothetical protein|nr:hypothetical protein [Accumulibacter sp.]
MPYFTCITTINDSIHLKQVEAGGAAAALREAVAALPYDDGAGPFDEELEWLRQVSAGEAPVTMNPVGHCKNTWLWSEGARHEPQYLTYVIQTDVS